MNLEYRHLLSKEFSPTSKVWIYQANRILSIGEALDAEALLNDFIPTWESHHKKVAAEGHLFFGQFIILLADEAAVKVGGCSTDSSVRFIKQLGEKYDVDFLNRELLAFYPKDKIELLPYQQVGYAMENGFINSETLYFNNLVATKEELETKWIVPVKESWLKNKLPTLQQL